MTQSLSDSVASDWTRLGVMLNVGATKHAVDLERLLLNTARVASANSRVFVLAVTWLISYGDYVAKHRLARLISSELEVEHRATLGLLLELAKCYSESNASRFNSAIDACRSSTDAKPLFDVERRNAHLARLAEQRASALSRKWGRWMSEFQAKEDALRPLEWVAEHNPELSIRALTGGDLAASVWAECQASGGIVESEAELARRCGASRAAVRDAVRRLQMAGLLKASERGRANVITTRTKSAA